MLLKDTFIFYILFYTKPSPPQKSAPKCEDEWIDEKGYEALYALFTKKPFKIGSLAIRIPTEIANVVGLKEGAGVKLAVGEKKIVIEPA